MPKGKADPEAVPFSKLDGQFLVIEEKVDGTGVCLFFDDNLDPQIWHRGSTAIGKEFKQLHNFFNHNQERFLDILEDRYVMFGEYMLYKHTIFYDRLPHLFLESDIYDRKNNIWLSTNARYNLLSKHSDYIRQVPVIATMKPSALRRIIDLVGKPLYQTEKWRLSLWDNCIKYNQPLDKVLEQTDQSGLMEGLYIKHEDDNEVLGRYKYVRFEFVENIINSGTHLIDRKPIYNLVNGGCGDWS